MRGLNLLLHAASANQDCTYAAAVAINNKPAAQRAGVDLKRWTGAKLLKTLNHMAAITLNCGTPKKI